MKVIATLITISLSIWKTVESHRLVNEFLKGEFSQEDVGAQLVVNLLYAGLLALFGCTLVATISYITCNTRKREKKGRSNRRDLKVVIANSIFAFLSSLGYVGIAIYDLTLNSIHLLDYESYIE